jgi:hypothetical protein
MTWSTADQNLRTLLSDGATDKHRYRKKVLGVSNSSNVSFKTFEFRRLTNFTSNTDTSLGVFKTNANVIPYVISKLVAADFSYDNPATGDFALNTALADGESLEASYYVQWFLDSEISQFLTTACNWLNLGDDFTQIGSGLRPAALKYAAAEAYQKLSLRWAEHLAETFMLNDAPDDKRMQVVESYRKQALDYRKEAESIRDDYYSRSGQQKQPLFGVVAGKVSDPVPSR